MGRTREHQSNQHVGSNNAPQRDESNIGLNISTIEALEKDALAGDDSAKLRNIFSSRNNEIRYERKSANAIAYAGTQRSSFALKRSLLASQSEKYNC